MSGIFGTFNVANKGMQAAQVASHTTGHNISNANTEGYSRQRVELKADLAFTLGGVGQLGSGVKMDSIIRMVDDYVTKQIRGENGTFSKYSVKSEVLDQMEIIFNEPSDTSLNFNLGEMFDAWTELSKNPEMLTSKSIVVEKSKTVAQTLNHIASQLEGLEDSTTDLIEMNAKNFNSIVESLDALNKQIFNTSVKGLTPNDLLDERDLMLKELSGITEFEASFDKFGRVEIKVGGKDIVLDASGVKLEMSMVTEVNGNNVTVSRGGDKQRPDSFNVADENIADYKAGQIILHQKDIDIADNTTVFEPTSGQIAGYQEALVEIQGQIIELDELAKTFAGAINKAHKDGEEGVEIFSYDDSVTSNVELSNITAKNIQINIEIDKNNDLIQAGKVKDGPEGNGSRALAIAGVRDNKYVYKDTGTGTGTVEEDSTGNTIEGIYNSMVTNIGISKQQADNMVSNQELLLNQLVMRRESTSGVNIDEEVTNLIKFQKSFDANARVIQVLSEMLDTLINRTGV